MRIEALTGYKNKTRQGNFPGYGKFTGYKRPGIKCVKIHLEIQDMEIFQDMEIILDMEAKHNTLMNCTAINRIKQIYRQSYNIHAYALN